MSVDSSVALLPELSSSSPSLQDIRHDLTEDFRSATTKLNIDMPLELPAKERAELEQQEYVRFTRQIESLTPQIEDTTGEARERYKAQRAEPGL